MGRPKLACNNSPLGPGNLLKVQVNQAWCARATEITTTGPPTGPAASRHAHKTIAHHRKKGILLVLYLHNDPPRSSMKMANVALVS